MVTKFCQEKMSTFIIFRVHKLKEKYLGNVLLVLNFHEEWLNKEEKLKAKIV